MPLLLFFGLWLVAELALLIYCLLHFGFLLTLGALLLSSTVGGLILRGQREAFLAGAGQNQPAEARDGVYHFTAGVLLLLPGFVSSLVALIFLIPPLRRLVGAALLKLFRPQMVAEAFFHFDDTQKAPNAPRSTGEPVTATREDGTVIEGELLDEERKR